MRTFLDEGGKGTQGFIEVIMDEIDDIRIDLAKKVNCRCKNYCIRHLLNFYIVPFVHW